MSNKQQRDALRVFHIIAGVSLGAFFYSPLGEIVAFKRVIQFGLIPILTISGIWMWQQGPIARLLKRDGKK